MKIFPALVFSSVLLVAGVAAGVSGHSLKSLATAGPDMDLISVRHSVTAEPSDRAFVGPVMYRAEHCSGDYVCDEYGAWMALHAAP
jgi:hypothetical protein